MQPCKSESVRLQSVLESVIETNGLKWFRFILGILKNEADAEDVLQEAVRRVLSRNRSFPSEEEVRMYLGRAIGNMAFEAYNSRKRDRMRNTPIQDSFIQYDNTPGPDACMEEREEKYRKDKMIGLLEKGLQQLPDKQEHAIRITILESEGSSLREVGGIHKIPYSTLRHRYLKGLERMRGFLERSLANK